MVVVIFYQVKVFFEIGGDSLLATRFITKVRELYKVEISLGEFFNNSKLLDIAGIISIKVDELDNMVEGEL